MNVLARGGARRRVDLHALGQGQRPDHLDHVSDDAVDGHRLHRQGQRPVLDLRDVARLVHELHQVPAGLQHHGDPLSVLRTEPVQAEQLAKAEDGVQRGAELVTEPVEEVLLGVVGAAQRLVSFLQGPVALLQALRQGQQVRLDPLDATLPGAGWLPAAGLIGDGPDIVGDVIQPMDDVAEPASRAEAPAH